MAMQKPGDDGDPKSDPAPDGGDPKAPDPKTGEPKTFTQEQVDRMMGTVRSEERGKFPDYSDLQKDSEALKALQAKDLSDAEKNQLALQEEQKKTETLTEQMKSTAINAEIRVQASQLGIVDPDAAAALVNRSSISYDSETGAVTGVVDALNTMLETKSYLKAPEGTVHPNTNARDGKTAVDAKASALNAQELEAANLLGVSGDRYAVQKAAGVNPAPMEQPAEKTSA